MSLNIPSPHLEFISDSSAILLDDYVIDTSLGLITIKRGYISDGASIPFIFWSLLKSPPFSGKLIPAALVHDVLFQSHYCGYYQANQIFFELAKRNNVPRIKCYIMLQTLNLVGWIAYKRQKNIQEALKHLVVVAKSSNVSKG